MEGEVQLGLTLLQSPCEGQMAGSPGEVRAELVMLQGRM